MKERARKTIEIPALCAFFFNPPKTYDEQTLQKVKKNPDFEKILSELANKLSLLEVCDTNSCDNLLQNVVAQFSVGFAKVGLPARLAITGAGGGPSLHDIIPIVGKDECAKRINLFLEKL
jgi:glutamyl-tRNA synthetase